MNNKQHDLQSSVLKQQLAPKLAELDMLAGQRLSEIKGQGLWFLPLCFIIGLFYSAIAFVAIPLWVLWHLKLHKSAVRNEVLKPFVETFGCAYLPEGVHALYERAHKHGLLPSHTEVDLKDAIQGHHKGLSFQLTELKLKHKEHQQADIQLGRYQLQLPFKNKKKVFEGAVLMLQLPFDVPTPVLLQKDVTEKAGIKQWQARFKGLKPVSVGQPPLETEFQIFALDAEDAKPLLSSDFCLSFLSFMNLIKLKAAQKKMFGLVFKPQVQAVAWRKQLLITLDYNCRFMEPEFFLRLLKSDWGNQVIDLVGSLQSIVLALKSTASSDKKEALPKENASENKYLKLVKDAG